jgi:hypothetical protein
MIIMANVICNDEYCEATLNKEDNSKLTFVQKAAIVSGYVVFAIALGAFLSYGVSAGYYPVLSFS